MMGGGSMGDINRLPRDCIAHLLSLTTPRDACRCSLVSPTFRSLADSDAVWDGFLPSDWEAIVSRAVTPVNYSTRKELYFRLSDSIYIDGGNKIFSLEKESGGKCYTLGARAMSVAGGDEQWWSWASHRDSRFLEVAELLDICWLEFHGKIDCRMLSPRTTYIAYLIFKTIHVRRRYGLGYPAQMYVEVGDNIYNHAVCLDPHHDHYAYYRPRDIQLEAEPLLPRARDDGWMEIEMGEFSIGEEGVGEVDMYLKEIIGGHWKRGLIIEGIQLRPKK